MHDLRFLTDVQYKEAQTAPLVVRQGLRETLPSHGEFVAEMARQVVFEAYGEDAYTRGLTVYTTIRKADQEAAYAALRRGVLDYDRRHGYRGPESLVNLPETPAELEAALEKAFQEAVDSDGLLPAVVLAASPTEVEAVLSDGETVKVNGDGLRFVARSLGDKAAPATRLRRGALIRLARDDKSRWTIAQLPTAEAAFVSMRPRDGAIVSLVGGFDFERNKFNHVTQALRQPGSSFKPFIYSAALEKGFTPATIVNDAPFFVPAASAGGEDWEPKNYDGKFEGPMRVRAALAKSKNLVTVRVLQAIGPQYAQDYIARFGFDPKLHPAYLTMGLGAGAVTPLQMVGAYSVFANGGYRVAPYLIARVVDARGNVLSEAKPARAGGEAERVIDPRNAWIMTSLLKDVIRVGTGTRALSLGRTDLSGKTGTTNENVDAWFCGYNAAIVAVSWIGFDQPRTLGANETGGLAALPIWIAYMQRALKGTPAAELPMPAGISVVQINPESGLRDESASLTEFFFSEFPPRARDDALAAPAPGRSGEPGTPAKPPPAGRDIRDQLF
jgi:penicillin-binding protein 1A